MRKIIIGIIFLTLLINTIPTSGEIIEAEDYLTLQDAVDAAQPGDTVYVNFGTYDEDIYIDKNIYLEGKSRNKVIITTIYVQEATVDIRHITAEGIGFDETTNCIVDDVSVVEICASYSPGLTVTNSYFDSYELGEGDGLIISNSENCNIVGNEFTGFWDGIIIDESSGTVFDQNTISDCIAYGLAIEHGTYEITNNAFYECGIKGDFFQAGQVVTGNTVNDRLILYIENQDDLHLDYAEVHVGQLILVNCNNLLLQNCRIISEADNIIILDSDNIQLINCNITNGHRGLFLCNINGGTISNNIFTYNDDHAIEGHNAENIVFTENDIDGTNEGGIYIGCENTYTNNNFKSRGMISAKDIDGESTWLKNYWDDYTGTDDDGDGFGDIPHQIYGGMNTDIQPRMNYNSWDDIPPTTYETFYTEGKNKDCLLLHAEDTGIGLSKIHYKIYYKSKKLAEWETSMIDAKIDLKHVKAIEYYSEDDLGNKEEIQFLEI